jgi:nitric oxide reductase NorQ protein
MIRGERTLEGKSKGMSDMARGFVQATVLQVLRDNSPKFLKVAKITEEATARLGYAVSAGAVDTACKKLLSDGVIEKLPLGAAAYGFTSASPAPATPMTLPAPPPAATAAPAAPAPPAWKPRDITRPNGENYRTRKLAGLDLEDVDALQKFRAAGIPVMLHGRPGTGKTAVIEAAFSDVLTINGDDDTSTEDFIGGFTRIPREGDEDDAVDAWMDGPLVTAMEEGRPLFVDDCTVIPAKVMAVVYPVMDGRGVITAKGRPRKLGRMVTAKEGFYIIAAHNPGTIGAVLSDALSSRFLVQIEVGTDLNLAKDLGVTQNVRRVATNLTTQYLSEVVTWKPEMRELRGFMMVAEVIGEEGAAANLIGVAPHRDKDAVAEMVQSVFGNDEITALRFE